MPTVPTTIAILSDKYLNISYEFRSTHSRLVVSLSPYLPLECQSLHGITSIACNRTTIFEIGLKRGKYY